LIALFVLIAEAGRVTPVEKVTELLKNLAQKVEQEGQAEAVAYDKYACFCKQQADDKQYAIETSNSTITQLTARINKLSAEISDLVSQIRALGTEIVRLDNAMKTNKQDRDADHANFTSEMAGIDSAIDTVERAIAALTGAKKALVGRAELEASLAQVAITAEAMLSDADTGRLRSLMSLGQPGDSYTYQYRSNDIIATLQDVLAFFKRRKEEVWANEFEARKRYDINQLSLKNQTRYAKQEKLEKENVHAVKSDEEAQAEADKDTETTDMNADKSFLNVLKADCENKATLWDQRSQTRANELTAISTAVDALNTGVAPNYKANKKLVGIQKSAAVKGHWVYVEDTTPAASKSSISFLQLGGVSLRGAAGSQSSSFQMQLASKAHQVLMKAADELKSPLLSVAALKVRAADDHFVKVRQIIKDLISQLEDQATAEATTKNFCDTEISAEVSRRDAEQQKAESLDADINVKESDKARLKNEIAKLSKQIASLKSALADATTLRLEEQKENHQTVSDAGVGRDAIVKALETLRTFYEGPNVSPPIGPPPFSTPGPTAGPVPGPAAPFMFLQRTGYVPFVPTNSDRDYLTVADRAPDIFNSTYHGSIDSSKGIIGLLEVILADFDRTGATVQSQENQAQTDFEDMERVNKQDTDTKENSKKAKDSSVTSIDGEIVRLTDELKSTKKAHAAALTALEKYHSMCIQGEETYAQRVAQRQKEIEALKEAHGILEDWQK